MTSQFDPLKPPQEAIDPLEGEESAESESSIEGFSVEAEAVSQMDPLKPPQ